MGYYKKFSEQLYKDYDDQACNAVMEYQSSLGSYSMRNPDMYGPDIILYHGFKPKYYVEAEVKRNWKADHTDFPFSTVQLPRRKGKLIGLGKPIEFWILREDLKFAVVISEESVIEERLVEVPNKFQAQGEFFYQIPIEECHIVDLG